MNGIKRALFAITLAGTLAATAWADTRPEISRLASRLEQEATAIAESGGDHFKGWSGEISDREQGILFKSEAFAAGCRLFIRLSGEDSGYYSRDYLRTNLYNAFLYLLAQYRDLESEVRRADMRSSSLGNCRELLDRMEREFARWPSKDNLAYLQKKYVQARNRTVYMIEKHGTGEYVRRPFRNLASLYRFNYDLRRGKDPWKYLEKIEEATLAKMPEADPIDMGFEGSLVMDQRSYPGRPVYRIQEGRKCPLASPQVLERLGGWSRVFEVPVEVLNDYPDGEPVR
jgi:hypothetical protein